MPLVQLPLLHRGAKRTGMAQNGINPWIFWWSWMINLSEVQTICGGRDNYEIGEPLKRCNRIHFSRRGRFHSEDQKGISGGKED